MANRAGRDPYLREIARRAGEIGVETWVVGGFVRDALLRRRSGDLDLAAGRGARTLVRALEASWGRRAYRFRKRGVTTWRFDLADRKIDIVDASGRGIDEDLRRRELTINAIAFDLSAERIHDPLRGIADLRRGVLRLPRPGVIREDPVRALRAARFLAQLPGFRLDRAAEREIRGAGRGLRRASVERIRDEIDRLLLAVEPHRGLEALSTWGLLESVLPELAPLEGCVAGAGRPDVWRHTVDAIERSAKLRGAEFRSVRENDEDRRLLRWALLLHDVSKPETLEFDERGRPAFHGHEVLGARRADALLARLRGARAFRRRVRRMVLLHLRPGHLSDSGATPRGLRRLVNDAEEDLLVLVAHAYCDARASGGPEARQRWRRLRTVLAELRERFEASRREPLAKLVTGDDVMRVLGIPPGAEVGRILEEIRSLQEDGALTDRRSALEHLEGRDAPGRSTLPQKIV